MTGLRDEENVLGNYDKRICLIQLITINMSGKREIALPYLKRVL